MSRPRLWEEDKVLGSTMALFHAKGYEATSLRELEEATGLHGGSLYHAYENKEGIFVAALGAYSRRIVGGRLERHLASAADPIEGLVDYFTSTYEDRPRPDPGCLVTNSAVEAPLHSNAAREVVAAGLELIRGAFVDALVRAGCAEAAAGACADALLGLYQGLLVLVRFGAPRSQLENVAAAVRGLAIEAIGNAA